MVRYSVAKEALSADHATMRATPPDIAIVGATGAVGREMLRVLEDRCFPHGRIRLLASERSAGMRLPYAGTDLPVEALHPGKPVEGDLALFAVGADLSRSLAPMTTAAGCTVIDNSSAFRQDPAVPLIIPEVNGAALGGRTEASIIANPNCSTIIALMAVTPLHRAVGIERMVVSTYQAASGAGLPGMEELEQQARDFVAGNPLTTDFWKRPYIFNLFSHDSPIGADGDNQEEQKLISETRRIWNDPAVRVTATCIRVPVLRAHSESINLTLRGALSPAEARTLLERAPGLRVLDDPANNRFPEPRDASGCDDVIVGRIRADRSQDPGKGLNLFVCSDQLRKGAALNAVQIAELVTGHVKEASAAWLSE